MTNTPNDPDFRPGGAFDRYDDPSRGPIDRAANPLDDAADGEPSFVDPLLGPIDGAVNVLYDGADGDLGDDDRSRGPIHHGTNPHENNPNDPDYDPEMPSVIDATQIDGPGSDAAMGIRGEAADGVAGSTSAGLGAAVGGALDGYDDPDRGPVDRVANAIDGVGTVSDDPRDEPLGRTANALDDPNRGPDDLAANALDDAHHDRAGEPGYDERGFFEKIGDAIKDAFDSDNPDRGPIDSLDNEVDGGYDNR